MTDKNYKLFDYAPEYEHFYVDSVGVSARDDDDSTFELMFMRTEVRPAFDEDSEGPSTISHQRSSYACSITLTKKNLRSMNSVITKMLEAVDANEQKK